MFGSVLTNPFLLGLIVIEAIFLLAFSLWNGKGSEYAVISAFLPVPAFVILSLIYDIELEVILTASIAFVVALLLMLFIRLRRKNK